MARASAILRCLALASRRPDQGIDLAEIIDVVYHLIERTIDRLDQVQLLNAFNGRAVAHDELEVSPVALRGCGPASYAVRHFRSSAVRNGLCARLARSARRATRGR